MELQFYIICYSFCGAHDYIGETLQLGTFLKSADGCKTIKKVSANHEIAKLLQKYKIKSSLIRNKN